MEKYPIPCSLQRISFLAEMYLCKIVVAGIHEDSGLTGELKLQRKQQTQNIFVQNIIGQ